MTTVSSPSLNHSPQTPATHFMLVVGERLTAVVFITPVRTVTKAITLETSNNAVDPIGTGKERRCTLGLDFS